MRAPVAAAAEAVRARLAGEAASRRRQRGQRRRLRGRLARRDHSASGAESLQTAGATLPDHASTQQHADIIILVLKTRNFNIIYVYIHMT